MDTIYQKKICLIGDFSVGKTSLIRRFVERQFSDQYLSTVGVKISRKIVENSGEDHGEKSKLQLLIWDIEGQTKFKSITPNYLQGAKGAIIVADVTRPETLEHIEEHLKLFFSVNPQGFGIVALNKIDKEDLCSPEDLAKIINKYQYPHHPEILSTYTTSAKTGINVDVMFQILATKILAEIFNTKKNDPK